jgi:gluconolactonase
MQTILDAGSARVFYDGMLTEPRLDHPEGVAVHRDGSVWCGGERGQVYRLEPDGSAIEQVATTEGFCLGLAFDRDDNLFICDAAHACVMRLDAKSGAVERFADGAGGQRMRNPNYPAFAPDGALYVSDSGAMKEPGPGIYRFSPDGSGELWHEGPVNFANGLALSPDVRYLYVAETFSNGVFRLPIENDGSAGEREEVVILPGALPDGLAFDTEGNLYVACYEPSQVVRITPDGEASMLLADPEAHLMCHPTNIAFRNGTLFTANLGRWHVTAVEIEAEGVPLYGGYRG